MLMERSAARSPSEGERSGDADRNREAGPEWETGQSYEGAGREGQAGEGNATERERVRESGGRRAGQVSQCFKSKYMCTYVKHMDMCVCLHIYKHINK